jgi:predicted transcriptional regulator
MAGRPTDFKPEYIDLARNYALLGAKREEIAEFLGVTRRTLRNWCKSHPEIEVAIQDGLVHANARVLGAHYRKCLEGDMTAIIFWEKNRMGWRDRIDTVARVGISPIDELLGELEGSTFKPKDQS